LELVVLRALEEMFFGDREEVEWEFELDEMEE